MRKLLFLFFPILTANAQKPITIWPGTTPAAIPIDSTSIPGDPLSYNIVQPILTWYPATGANAVGTSVIICPGGSFCYLHIKTEGTDVAEWLNKKGIAAFVLQYRVVHSETNHPMQEKTDRMKDTANARRLVTPVVAMAIADGRQALTYVRQHARELGIDPGKIGMIGFSAGGALSSASAYDYTIDNRPDFIASIYPFVPPSLTATAPKDAPPLFIAAATDDEYHLVPMSLGLYSKWLASGHSAEIHIYSKGGHGFGMNRQNQPSDTWIDRFGDWLHIQGFL
jgi:acetyl esterase/lipase